MRSQRMIHVTKKRLITSTICCFVLPWYVWLVNLYLIAQPYSFEWYVKNTIMAPAYVGFSISVFFLMYALFVYVFELMFDTDLFVERTAPRVPKFSKREESLAPSSHEHDIFRSGF